MSHHQDSHIKVGVLPEWHIMLPLLGAPALILHCVAHNDISLVKSGVKVECNVIVVADEVDGKPRKKTVLLP